MEFNMIMNTKPLNRYSNIIDNIITSIVIYSNFDNITRHNITYHKIIQYHIDISKIKLTYDLNMIKISYGDEMCIFENETFSIFKLFFACIKK